MRLWQDRNRPPGLRGHVQGFRQPSEKPSTVTFTNLCYGVVSKGHEASKLIFFVGHQQLRAIDKTGQTKPGSQERLTATGTRLINTSLQPTPCQTGKGDTSYRTVTRTGVAMLARVKNSRDGRKRSNSSTGHFDTGWFSSWFQPYPN